MERDLKLVGGNYHVLVLVLLGIVGLISLVFGPNGSGLKGDSTETVDKPVDKYA